MYGGYTRVAYSYKDGASLTSTKQVFELKRDEANDRISADIPFWAMIDAFHVELSSISGATTVYFTVCRDANGDYPITEEMSINIATGATTPARGGGIAPIGVPWVSPRVDGVDVGGSVYVVVSLDAGTATGNLRLLWRA